MSETPRRLKTRIDENGVEWLMLSKYKLTPGEGKTMIMAPLDGVSPEEALAAFNADIAALVSHGFVTIREDNDGKE